jgi:proteasome activator subunit 4
MIYVTCEVIFEQLSDEFQDLAVAMIFKKAQSTITPTATEAIGILCGYIPRKKRLAKFLPLCIDRIEEEIENGAGSTPTGNRFVSNSNPFDFAKMSDASLHWFQSILMNIVGQSGLDLLKYRSEIERIIELTVTKCLSKRGYLWAGYLIRMVLESLSTTYILECRSHNLKTWNNADFKKNASQKWGEKVDLEDLDISWHVPSEAEISFATDLATKYLQYTETGLNSLIAIARETPAQVSGSEFRRLISHLNNCIIGIGSFIQPSKDEFDHDNYGEFTATFTPQKKPVYLKGGYIFCTPSDPKYILWLEKIQSIRVLLLQLLKFFTNERDDIDTIKVLVTCVQSHLSDDGVYDLHHWMHKFYKNLFKTGKDLAVLPRLYFVKAVQKIHFRRVQNSRKAFPTTRIVRDIFNSLFDLSLSKFAEVRKSAQSALFSSLRHHRNMRFDIFSKTMSVFKETAPDRDIDRVKGALYILRDRNSIMGVYSYYWFFTSQFIDALLSLQGEEKPSILELGRTIFLDFTKIFTPIQISVNIPDHIKLLTNSASTLTEEVAMLGKEQKRKEGIAIRAQTQLHTSLVDRVTKKINWKFLTMSIVLFDLLLSPTLPISPDFMGLVFSWIIDEHPSIRASCNALLCHIMDTMKDRARNAGTSAMSRLKKKLGAEASNFQVELHATVHFDKNATDVTVFADKPMSWLIRPKVLTLYDGFIPDGTLPYEDLESAESQKLMIQKFRSESFWESWLGFAAMENPRDAFSKTTAGFYKQIFGLTQDSCLEFLFPKLQKLVQDVKENSSQRAASEIIAGILRGSKHWSLLKKVKWDSKISELLFEGINASSMETVRHWLACLRYTFDSRNINRFGLIVKQILDTELDLNNPSFLTESKKIWLKDQLLKSFSYQLCNHVDGLLNSYYAIIVTPYQLVRDSVGRSFDNCLQISHNETFETLDLYLNYCVGSFSNFETAQLRPHSVITAMFEKLKGYRAVSTIGDPLSEYALASKTCKH